jgi:thiamine-monophosphate kinase
VRTLTPRLTEDQLVGTIIQALGEQPRRLVVGIGDDAAAWKAPRSHLSLITTDALVDGVHFRLAATTPRALGHKSLAVNLSDIAAMGGTPALAVVALGVTDEVDEQWARDFYAGMAKLAKQHACAIAGGDIVRAPVLTIAVTVVGDVRKSGLRRRSGVKPGDVACVTGPLGLAAAGLQVCSNEQCSNGSLGPFSPQHEALLRASYETPTPRVQEGQMLGSSGATHAMMDISDGLSLDVSRMARASQVDICLDLAALKPHPALAEFQKACSNGPSGPLDAAELMLHGGDDYELLVAVDPRSYPHLAKRFKARFKRDLAPVGRFEKGSGNVWLLDNGKRREHAPRGYDHLSNLT